MKAIVSKLIDASLLVILVAGLLTIAIGSAVFGFTIGVLIRFLMFVVLVMLVIVIVVLGMLALIEQGKRD